MKPLYRYRIVKCKTKDNYKLQYAENFFTNIEDVAIQKLNFEPADVIGICFGYFVSPLLLLAYAAYCFFVWRDIEEGSDPIALGAKVAAHKLKNKLRDYPPEKDKYKVILKNI